MAQENTPSVQMAALYGKSSPAVAPQAPRPVAVRYAPRPKPIAAIPVNVEPAVRRVTVEVIRGDKRETSTFEMKRP
jgi:hypothetical protein